MQDSALVKLCRNLSKPDFKRLRKVVRSPFFNQREDVILLFDYLESNLEKGDDRLLRERVFAKVFPENKVFDMQLLRYTSSFLLNTIREWLSIEEMRADGSKELVYLQTALKKLGADDLRTRELPESLAKHRRGERRDAVFFRQHFQLLFDEYDVELKQNRGNEHRLGPVIEALTISHVSALLSMGCTVRAAQNFSGKNIELPLLTAAIEYVEAGNFREIPAVMGWFHTFRCLESSENEADFFELKKILLTANNQFSTSEFGDMHISAINFCIRRANQGRKDFLLEAFELYKSGFQTGALLAHGRLSKYTYKNAAILGIHLGEFEWVNGFLADFKKFLPTNDGENLFNLSSAKASFQQKKYDEALLFLQEVALAEEPLYNLDARRMLVRIFYEQGSFDALDSQLDSYSAYLRRHKEVGYHRENHLHFIGWIRKLMRADLRNAAVKGRLREKLAGEKSVLEKDWLLEQLK